MVDYGITGTGGKSKGDSDLLTGHHIQSRSKSRSATNKAVKKKQFFDIILTREHCVIDKSIKVICRNKDLFLEGRSIKNLLFISNDLKDSLLVH